MKFLIVGLGNIGREYDGTRHNVGFEAVDVFAKKHGATWRSDQFGAVADAKSKGRTFVLLKPNTYMNLSGKAIRFWLQKEKIAPENLLVICDDLNLDFGKLRMKPKGSDGGHNGLKSIQESLQSSEYPRLRVGIGSDFGRGKQVNFVLGKWSKDEEAELGNILEKIAVAIEAFGFLGINQAMNSIN